MAVEILKENVSIHQTLGDEPNTDNGLSADDLKAQFDRGAEIIRDYINDTLVAAVNNAVEKSENAESSAGGTRSIAEGADKKATEAMQKAVSAEAAATTAAQVAHDASDLANSADKKAQQSLSDAAEALRISQEVAQEMVKYSPEGTRSIAEAAMRMANERLVAPETAAVGQYFRVKEVDENGAVTAVEAVDAPSGGGGGLTTTEKALMLTLFKNAGYATDDMLETYEQLEALWGETGGDEETKPDTPSDDAVYRLENVVYDGTFGTETTVTTEMAEENDFTIAFNMTDIDASQATNARVFFYGDSSDAVSLYVQANSTLRIFSQDIAPNYINVADLMKPTKIVITHSANSAKLQLRITYYDLSGNMVAESFTGDYYPHNITSASVLRIGMFNTTYQQYFKGTITEFAVYPRVFTADEVSKYVGDADV